MEPSSSVFISGVSGWLPFLGKGGGLKPEGEGERARKAGGAGVLEANAAFWEISAFRSARIALRGVFDHDVTGGGEEDTAVAAGLDESFQVEACVAGRSGVVLLAELKRNGVGPGGGAGL